MTKEITAFFEVPHDRRIGRFGWRCLLCAAFCEWLDNGRVARVAVGGDFGKYRQLCDLGKRAIEQERKRLKVDFD